MSDEHEREEREGEEEETGAKPDELGDAGKKALNAERRARTAAERELKELRAKVREAEDAEKSEVERLKGQVDELTKQAKDAESKVIRFEVAAEKGLTPAQARRLVGATKEELEADADEMRAELGLDKETGKETEEKKTEQEQQEETPIGSRPKEVLRSGEANEEEEQPDAGKLADSILNSGW